MFGFLKRKQEAQPEPKKLKRTQNYKTVAQFTPKDFDLIDMHREMTGIYGYSDEYYFNHFVSFNFA